MSPPTREGRPSLAAETAPKGSDAHTQSTSLHAGARWYAQNGVAVFPLAGREKKPLRGTRGVLDATIDLAQIDAWWADQPEANIGAATGEPSRWAVVDVDPRAGGEDSLERLEAAVGHLPDTLTSFTGGGGLHLIYRHPGHKVKSRANAFAEDLPGLDVKGDGGYIVLPPSIHPTGAEYIWSRPGGALTPVAPWPEILDHLLTWEPPRPVVTAPRAEGTEGRYAAAALDGELERVAAAGPGGRNDALNAAAFNLGQLVGGGRLGEDLARDQLLAVARSIGLTDREAAATIASGLRSGKNRPRGGAA